MKILHFADLHLDRSFHDIGHPPAIGQLRREGLITILKKIAEIAKLRQVDLVTIAGDLFEQDTLMPSTLKLIAETFRELSPIPVLIAPGQADNYRVDAPYSFWEFPPNVHIFNAEALSPFSLDAITIWGAASQNSPLSQLLDECEIEEGLNILLFHLAQNDESNDNAYPDLQKMKAHHISFALLGGKHQYEAFQGGIMAGSPEIIEVDSESSGYGISLLSIDGGQIQSEFIMTGQWNYLRVEVDVSECQDISEVEERVRQIIKANQDTSDHCTIILTGMPKCFVDLPRLADAFDIPAKFVLRVTYPYELNMIAKEPTVRGFLAKQFLNHLENTKESEHSQIMNAFLIALQALDGVKELTNAVESN